MLEARDRGVVHADGTPNTRLFRAHLRMWGVRVQGRGKCQLVCPEEIDAALDRRAHAQRASLSTSESQAAQAARSIMERGKR